MFIIHGLLAVQVNDFIATRESSLVSKKISCIMNRCLSLPVLGPFKKMQIPVVPSLLPQIYAELEQSFHTDGYSDVLGICASFQQCS